MRTLYLRNHLDFLAQLAWVSVLASVALLIGVLIKSPSVMIVSGIVLAVGIVFNIIRGPRYSLAVVLLANRAKMQRRPWMKAGK